MKKIFPLIVLCFCLLGVNSCTKKAQTAENTENAELTYDESVKDGVIEMDTSNLTYSATLNGHKYDITIVRKPDPSMPKVKDPELGESSFMDNNVTLTIQKDGAEFFSKVFTKNDFNRFLDDGFKANGLLDGFVFDENSKGPLRFSVSVSYPQSDTYIPLIVNIGFDQSMTMKKDNIIDDETPDEE